VRRYTGWTLAREVSLIVVAIIWMIPFYFLVIVSVKPDVEALQTPLSFPDELHLSNFSTAWNDASLDRSLVNSLIITGGSVLALIAIGSICAYAIARRPGRLSTTLYFLFVLAIILPFQLGLVPTYALMREFAVFLYTGFVMALPKEYEEASRVDGATSLRTFRKVVFPLLRPVTGTVAIFTGLIIWNDFFLSLIYLNGTDKTPLPVAVYTFVGAFASRWNLIFAAVLVSLLPIMLFFLFAQRQLIRGFTGGIKS
jgi:raffinose/stachyose/melibiose transport system permease protein